MPRPLIPALLLLSAAAVAAPVPKESDEQKLARLFGTPADPPKGCKLVLDGDALRVTAPAGIHSFQHPGGATGVRTARRVTGDFTAEAAVRIKFPEGAAGLLPREDAVVLGGLIVRRDADRAVLHQFGWKANRPARRGGPPGPFRTRFQWGPLGPGPGGEHLGADGDADDGRVRLVRRGSVLNAWGNWGSKQKDQFWVCPDGMELPGLPAAVEVGVVVEHWLNKPVEVVFREFTVTPADPPKK